MFGFPKIERTSDFQYKTSFLKSVVFQFSYATNSSIVENTVIRQDALKSKFPNTKPVFKGEAHIVSDKTPLIQKTKSTAEGIEFRTKDNNIVIAFTNDFLTISMLGDVYSNFYDTFKNIRDDFFPLLEKAGVSLFERLAIRKVNLFTFSIENESKPSEALPIVFNNSLVDNILFLPCQNYLDSGVMKFTFSKEEYHLNLICGLLKKQPDTNVNQLVLDIDIFKSGGTTSIDNAPKVMENINSEIFNIFNWALRESMLEKLETVKGE